MVEYDLSHLTQSSNQVVYGPIQDDEALFLFSLIRGSCLKRILEIGGMSGYSAKNFLAATSTFEQSNVYTVDINVVPVLSSKHKCIQKNALNLTVDDLDGKPLDLIFFDCHDNIQFDVFNHLKKQQIITDDTVIALHDTNLHYKQHLGKPKYIPTNDYHTIPKEQGGFVHQEVERTMVNYFHEIGYDCFSIKTRKEDHSENLPFRHGLTICQKFKKLQT